MAQSPTIVVHLHVGRDTEDGYCIIARAHVGCVRHGERRWQGSEEIGPGALMLVGGHWINAWETRDEVLTMLGWPVPTS